MENNGLRKEIKLGGMIAMAAGGMVAAWMVEIKYWFEIGGVGSFLSLVACAIMVLRTPVVFYLFRADQHDAICRRAEHLDLECVRLEYRLCRLLGDPALVCHGNADRILWDCQHVGIYFPDHQYAIKNYFYRNFGNLVLPDKFGTENFS